MKLLQLQGAALAVVHKGDRSIGFYDAASGALEDLILIDPFPHEMAVDQAAGLAYISHFGVALAEDGGMGGNTVSVVDLHRREKAGCLDCGQDRRPHGLCLDDAGRLYVVSEGSSRLLICNPANTDFGDRLPTLGQGSHMVSVTPDGRSAFVSNMFSGTLSVFDLDRKERVPAVFEVGARPEGSHFDRRDARLYITNRESAELAVFDVRARRLLAPVATRPGPVRVTAAGRTLIVPMFHDRSVGLIEIDDPGSQRYLPLPGRPVSVSYDAQTGCAFVSVVGDRVWVLDVAAARVLGEVKTRPDPDPTYLVHPA